jgi:hypothetical protein
MKNNKMIAVGVLCSFISTSVYAQGTMSLEDFVMAIKKKNTQFQSFNSSKEAAELKVKSGDIALSPVLFLSASYLNDKKQPNQLSANESVAQKYSLGFSQKFSTGTNIKISSDLMEVQNNGIQSPIFSSYAKYASGSLGVSLSQSLLKDGFGELTTLRRERELIQKDLETYALTIQERQQLLEAELLFWDSLYLDLEVKQREASLQRAVRIESWIQKRYNDGIADKADMMNAKALKATREFQLISSLDEQKSNAKKVRDFLELAESEANPVFKGDIGKNRSLSFYLRGTTNVSRMDVQVSILEATLKKTLVKEVGSNQKSDLQLSAAYNTNAYDATKSAFSLTSDLSKTNTPTTQVGLTWTYLWDTEEKRALTLQTEKELQVSELKLKRKKIESQSVWEELNRRYKEFSNKIEALSKVAEFQRERAKAEQDKLAKGRSITSQVITSEQESSESELTLIKLKAEQRKLESQGLLFTEIKE